MKERNVTVTLDKAREWFNSGNATLREVALQAFNKDELMGDFRRITTFKKACEVLGFDYTTTVSEEVEVNERIKNFHDAREALGRKPNPIRVIPSHVSSKIDLSFDSVVSLVGELNPKHLESLVALNQLFTIAEAWNKEDNFVPDFSDYNQAKWFPCFEYNKGTAKFVFDRAHYTLLCANAPTQLRLCFMTPERAKQFGEQFIDIYNKVLCNKYGR